MPNVIEETNQPSLNVEIIIDPTVSYASYQNHVPLLRSLRLANEGNGIDTPGYRNIEILIRTEPMIADVLRLRFDTLGIGENRQISPLDLKFNHAYLAELSEREHGRLIVQVLSHGHEILELDRPIEILAYDQWAGTRGPCLSC